MSGRRSILSVVLVALILPAGTLFGQFLDTGQPPGFLLKWGSNGGGDGEFIIRVAWR